LVTTVDVIVDVIVVVIAPMIVAALVNGNDIVVVIDAVSDATDRRERPIAQSQALHDRKGLGDGVRFAPRRSVPITPRAGEPRRASFRSRHVRQWARDPTQ
jgi:hypothetical protein